MEQISGIAEVEDFWLIVVSEGIEDETETVDMPDGCHQGDRGHSLGYPQTKYPAEEKVPIVVDGLRSEETIAIFHCASKATADVTKEFTLDQILGYGPTVHHHKWTILMLSK